MNGSTESRSVCKQCTKAISRGSDVIVCEGFCTDVFHAACVNVTHEELINYRRVSNFWWICDTCIDIVRTNRKDHSKLATQIVMEPASASETPNVADEIAELKEQIAEIQQTLASITVSRSESNLSSANEIPPLAESSPLSIRGMQFGTKNVSNRNITAETSATDGLFWLFFTRIKNNVTEQDMCKVVSASLNDNDAIVRKLVPAWKNTSEMPYISFKVGINVRLKDKALLSTTWPAGISFREFRDNVWQPPHQ